MRLNLCRLTSFIFVKLLQDNTLDIMNMKPNVCSCIREYLGHSFFVKFVKQNAALQMISGTVIGAEMFVQCTQRNHSLWNVYECDSFTHRQRDWGTRGDRDSQSDSSNKWQWRQRNMSGKILLKQPTNTRAHTVYSHSPLALRLCNVVVDTCFLLWMINDYRVLVDKQKSCCF